MDCEVSVWKVIFYNGVVYELTFKHNGNDINVFLDDEEGEKLTKKYNPTSHHNVSGFSVTSYCIPPDDELIRKIITNVKRELRYPSKTIV